MLLKAENGEVKEVYYICIVGSASTEYSVKSVSISRLLMLLPVKLIY
jgi:hypothetical protein